MKTLKLLVLSLLLSVISLPTFAQSHTVAEFAEIADGYNLYLYQSMIRMLNKDKNPDFNMLIRDLDHLRFCTTEEIGTEAKTKFTELDNGIQGEGFEAIMTYDNKDYKCHIYEKTSSDGETSWVATMYINGRAGVFEMKGSLNMKYLHAFQSLNIEKLQQVLPLEDIEKDVKKEIEEK